MDTFFAKRRYQTAGDSPTDTKDRILFENIPAAITYDKTAGTFDTADTILPLFHIPFCILFVIAFAYFLVQLAACL
jgi:hypothetical protein